MNFDEYQKESKKTALYKDAGDNFIYPTLGLAGETGEVVEKMKKIYRNDNIISASDISREKKIEVGKELGDVLWYLAQLATELDLSLGEIAKMNIEKLASRKERGVLHSEGDNR